MTEFLNKLRNKSAKIEVIHKIFGKQKIEGKINDMLDDNDYYGIVIAGAKIYCNRKDTHFSINMTNGEITLQDSLMTIKIS